MTLSIIEFIVVGILLVLVLGALINIGRWLEYLAVLQYHQTRELLQKTDPTKLLNLSKPSDWR